MANLVAVFALASGLVMPGHAATPLAPPAAAQLEAVAAVMLPRSGTAAEIRVHAAPPVQQVALTWPAQPDILPPDLAPPPQALVPQPAVSPQPEPSARPVAKPRAKPEARPEGKSKAKPQGSKSKAKPAAPKPSPKPEARSKPKPEADQKPAPKPTAKPSPTTYEGTSKLWYPALGIKASWKWYGCEYGGNPKGLGSGVYRWGCTPKSNVYLMSHAWSTFKAVKNGYHSGKMKVGQSVWYADPKGKVSQWRVKWIKRVKLSYFNATFSEWASNASPSQVITFQTCDGSNDQYRIIVRLVRDG